MHKPAETWPYISFPPGLSIKDVSLIWLPACIKNLKMPWGWLEMTEILQLGRHGADERQRPQKWHLEYFVVSKTGVGVKVQAEAMRVGRCSQSDSGVSVPWRQLKKHWGCIIDGEAARALRKTDVFKMSGEKRGATVLATAQDNFMEWKFAA